MTLIIDMITHTTKQIFELGTAYNFDNMEVLIQGNKQHTIKTFQKTIEQNTICSTFAVGIRVEKNHQIGLSFTQSTEKSSLIKMLEMANANMKLVPAQPHHSIVPKLQNQIWCPPDIYRNKEISSEDKKSIAIELENAILKNNLAAKIPHNVFNEKESFWAVAFTPDHLQIHQEKHFGINTATLLENGGNKAIIYQGQWRRGFDQLNHVLLANECYRKANEQLEASSVKSGKYAVIFSQEILEELLSFFQINFSGKAVCEKKSAFIDMLGKVIAHPLLSIVDRPCRPHSFQQRIFDAEGSPCQDLCLIQKGVLQNFLHNSQTAKELGLINNARAHRSAACAPNVDWIQLEIAAGTTPDSEVLQHQHLYIYKIQGLVSGSNYLTGDFSFGAAGVLKKNGQIIQVVKDITISGNFFNLLKNIAAIGDRLHTSSSIESFFAPTILFSDLDVAGD